MSDCTPLNEAFSLKPSVYLSVDPFMNVYNLYVSFTVPPYTTVKLDDYQLENAHQGGIKYLAEESNDGCPDIWEFQQVFNFPYSAPSEQDSKVGVEVVSSKDGKPNGSAIVIVHHADADEEGA